MDHSARQYGIEVAPTTVKRSPRRTAKIMMSAGIGHFIEWFDFGLYGTLAAIIASNFFVSADPATALLKSFAVFGSGFLMRPLGGLFFGSMGDRLGRRKVLVTVIVITSLSTFVMGILPTWHQAGIIAPILLVITRLVQGFAAGGESSGVITYLAESAAPNRRATLTCWSENFSFMAFVCGSGLVLLLTHTLGDAAMNDWGWRIPFLLAAPLGLGGLYMRRNMEDSAAFHKLQASGKIEKSPLRKTLSSSGRALLFCVGFVVVKAVSSWVLQSFMPGYLSTHLHYSRTDSYLITTLGLLSVAVCMPLTGYLSDRWGRRPLMLMGCGGFILLTYPAMLLMTQGSVMTSIAAMSLLGVFVAMFNGGCGAAMVELFPTAIRYGGIAVAYNLTVAVFGGVTPLASASLIAWTGDPLSPAWYVMITALVSFIAVWFAKETAGKILD
ncbi:MHS family proline/betaine transporter-like MFS transporter [Pantoea sp. AN62]|jgi:MHS family proline/betaine transporter-like MFS transporter|uniref:MFS transporter n=2 Tax=Pantoea brenneri TaxID=472694 RepID=A0A653N1F3_9GAMM|nr:MFS transporter [Pantoea sp.]NUY43968.1 MFS transporter [Pantoea brenneri]OXM25558.1 MFS transporter [Pantoea sp. AV62]NUY51491.1 MFS transporter [Pantoea brenneri]NUY61852.1 MFS transporter [Pantoea brenneri]